MTSDRFVLEDDLVLLRENCCSPNVAPVQTKQYLHAWYDRFAEDDAEVDLVRLPMVIGIGPVSLITAVDCLEKGFSVVRVSRKVMFSSLANFESMIEISEPRSMIASRVSSLIRTSVLSRLPVWQLTKEKYFLPSISMKSVLFLFVSGCSSSTMFRCTRFANLLRLYLPLLLPMLKFLLSLFARKLFGL